MNAHDAVIQSVDEDKDALIALSHGVHSDAELGYEEFTSSQRVAAAMDAAGFSVEHGTCDLETAVRAEFGSGPLTIGIVAEYDALPGVGHACGHNIIAAAGVGAAIALAPLADELGITIRLLGTPAEEGGGGKIYMMDRGAFDGLHAAIMVHPAPYDAPYMPALAVQHFAVSYEGRSAHASASPHLGINAADALTVAQVAIGLLRQHILPTDRVHGIITDGGDAPNVVPSHAGGSWYVRAATIDGLADIKPKVHRCFEAGAIATGSKLTIDEPRPAYSEFRNNDMLSDLYVEAARDLGREFPADGSAGPMQASTDMGNVSLAMPSIHPLIGIDSGGAVNHQPEFTAHAIKPSADRAVRDGAIGLAQAVATAATTQAIRDKLLATAYQASA